MSWWEAFLSTTLLKAKDKQLNPEETHSLALSLLILVIVVTVVVVVQKAD